MVSMLCYRRMCFTLLWMLVCKVGLSSSFLPSSQHHQQQQKMVGIITPSHIKKMSKQIITTTTRQAEASSSTTERNIFHNYNGPIVLIGCSSTNQEITRLAEGLKEKQFSSRSTTVQISEKLDEFLQEGDIINQYKWPDILLLDMSTFNDDNNYNNLQNIAKSLYEDNNVLSIYVNVDTEQLSSTLSVMKSQLDETIFVKYSDYEICIRDEGDIDKNTNWEHIEWELIRILARARLIPAIPGDKYTNPTNSPYLTMGQHTFFVSLTFPDITQAEPYVEEICKDVDAMEYRTDLLSCRDNRFDLLYGMQLLRKYCRPYTIRSPVLPFESTVIEDNMPIVYTVRTQNQAGAYPDDIENGIPKMFNILHWGLRGGVEVLDVESAWDYEKTIQLLTIAEKRYSSQILGSHHVVGKEVTIEDAVQLFEQCALNGHAHGAKVVLSINDEDKDRMAYEAALITTELAQSAGNPVIPNISLILGEIGQFSRIINIPFTPVTHESLPFTAAPGQLTASEIMTTRLLTKIFEPKRYAILGHNIAYSVSPQMHNAAFAATRLPHQYVRADVPTVEEFVESKIFKSDDFGGCSVTIPHKQSIMPYLDVLSDAAKAIGSVNTVIARIEFINDDFKRILYGDNTDWKGIYNPLNRLLGSTVDNNRDCALILGAGGTARAAAYVADKLGLKRIYYNRTPSKAKELANTFGGTVVNSLDEKSKDEGTCLGDLIGDGQENRIRVVISTLPASSDFILPEWLLSSENDDKPFIFDVNYKPYQTKLLSQAEDAGCTVVRGSEMLWEQGVGQFELWTGRTAPYSVMKQIVLDNCNAEVVVDQQK